MCYQAKGDLDAAIELTKKYIAQEPEDILAYTNLGTGLLIRRRGWYRKRRRRAPRRGGSIGSGDRREERVGRR